MTPSPEVDTHLRELKWRELTSRVDAYRFYIKLILEVNAFYYATTGAVMLYYLKDKQNVTGLFLLLPIVMGTVVGGFMTYATVLQSHNHRIIQKNRTELRKLGIRVRYIPDLTLLDKLLWVFGHIFSFVALALSFVPLVIVHDRIIGILVSFSGFLIVSFGYWFSRRSINKYREQIRGRPISHVESLRGDK